MGLHRRKDGMDVVNNTPFREDRELNCKRVENVLNENPHTQRGINAGVHEICIIMII